MIENLKFVFAKWLAASLLLGALSAQAQTLFYVDSLRFANGNGSQANPWKALSDINWSTINSALSNGPVILYLSSRANWTGVYFNIGASGKGPANMLRIIGDQHFNTSATGAATWENETTGKRALLTGNGSGGTIYIDAGRSNIVLQGVELNKPTWGGITIGQSNPTTNVWNITIANCFVHDVVNGTGISFLYAETNCHSITVSHCIVSNAPAEGIYLGHFDYMSPTILNCVVEHNTLVNTGTQVEGDIDIKPGVKGAIVRYNTHYRNATLGAGNCGVVIAASDCQVYGNRFHHSAMKPDGDWGYGIYVTADGDGRGRGQAINNTLIYNNLLYSNRRNGIRLLATTATPGADIRGTRIWNNTIWGNAVHGFEARGFGGRTIEVIEFKNNIVGGNASYEISCDGQVTLAGVDNNLYYRAAGNSWNFNGEKTFAAWRALGFDANGKVGDPLFVNVAAENFQLQSGSIAINSGVSCPLFSTDVAGYARGSSWDIGACERVASVPTLDAPRNLRTAPAP